MSWAGKRIEIVSIAFLMMGVSMYGMLFPLNVNVVAGTEISGHITTDTNWTVWGSPYWIVDDTFVDRNVTLNVEKGVSVLFNGSYYFNVSGNLVTHGDPTASVVFTSEKMPDPLGEYWKGIHVKEKGSLVMEYTHVSYALCGVVVGTEDFGGQSYVDIRGSEIVYNKDCGVSVIGGHSQLYVTASRVSHNYVGIDLGHSFGSIVEGTSVTNNDLGIIGNYSYSRIHESTISDNTHYGIFFGGNVGTNISYSQYFNNVISGNGLQTPPGWQGAGLYLNSAMYDFVMCNVISRNGAGLDLINSLNVSVTQNDFVYNQDNANDDLSNTFDDGYKGNYWDDYNGTDSNGDGIGDIPYFIDNNSVDHYPLIYPVGGCGAPNEPPVANANGPYSGKIGWPVEFNGTGSYDVDGCIVEFEWDFGDGSPKGYGYRVNHTYSSGGIFNVTLKVTDDDGANGTDETYAEIIDGHPAPPRVIDGALSGPTWKDFELSWELSGDDGGGEDDLLGYNIYRGTTYDPDCIGYSFLMTVSPGSDSWIDVNAGHGDPNTYFYCIGAEDNAAQESLADRQASKFAKHMNSGMVLMSMPLQMSDNHVTTVFQTVSYVRVIYYDAMAGKRHNWKTFDTRKPYFDFEYVDHKMALWVEVSAESYFTVAGLVPQETTIHLVTGWNFVGYPSFIDRTVSDTLTVHYQTIESYEPLEPPWYLTRLAAGDMMTAGEGYWIHVSEDYDWVLTN
ncbi:MAG: right-handed parallel beta-helix repeat-containing protein [Methanobacteriota archaeon]|nr:MAG: right-handed parallel beta-helix repeat-containing protein [Euryarchaeota archaeon]